MTNADKEPLFYGKKVVDGISLKADSRDSVRRAITERVPVMITSQNDYINLYHVFTRMVKTLGSKDKLKLSRQMISESKWIVSVVDAKIDKSERPTFTLENGFDPRRGRYKRYAELLTQGDVLAFTDREEAVRARRAWQLYVPKAERKHLRSTIKKVPRNGRFVVSIVERAG